ncbi:MAG: hypothetical protein U0935_01225 [Pirellulales bacterium]
MNKAFLRESDSTDEFCPRCGAAGVTVQRSTVLRLVREPETLALAEVANFCPTPTCEVAYFDGFERVVPTVALRHGVYPKDPAAPICCCFGLTTADIELDLAEGTVTRTKACLLQAQSPQAECQTRSPTGRSCVADVQRYYLQRKNAAGNPPR